MSARLLCLSACVALTAGIAAAQQDFSQDSEAEEWGLYGESPARFAASVVDPLCELAGDCPEDCGGGDRQLALLREADGVMILPMKNAQPLFTGAPAELQPFCGQEVEVDGLLITDEDLGARNLYMIQKIRALGDEEWTPANRWTEAWAEANPEAAEAGGAWYRNDPRIQSEIEAEGYLGLGAEADAEFLREWFQ